MNLQTAVAIIVASSALELMCNAASNKVVRQAPTDASQCDPENGTSVAELVTGLDQACIEAAKVSSTMHDVYCQSSCSGELIAAFEDTCSDCGYRELAAKRCYRFNTSYSCEQLNTDIFTDINLIQLRAISSCFDPVNSTACNISLTSLVDIMGCCFNAVYNTTVYERQGLGLASFELQQTYNLRVIEDCLTLPFEDSCSITSTMATTNGVSGLGHLGSAVTLIGTAALLALYH